MNTLQVCMFCRYKRRRGQDLEACCAGAEVLDARAKTGGSAAPSPARGMPERLRHPAPQPHQAPR